MPRGRTATRFAVIMAGGAGTRFWPASRRQRPKQLLPITSRRSMLQETVARLQSLVPPERTVIVTGRDHAEEVRQQLPELPAGNILVEPLGRNTAPCIAAAAEWIHRRAPDSTMVVLPADHAIAQPQAFRRTLRRAFSVAERQQALVTLGVRPTRPETGYGYIKLGAALDRRAPAAHRVVRFREKPTAAAARRFVASGHYLWNAGIFVWRTAVIREALHRYLPEVAGAVAKLPAVSDRLPATVYRRLPAVSIDVAVMEKAAARAVPPVAVVAAEFGWSDVGSWAAVADLWRVQGGGNRVRGKAVLLDSDGVTVFSDHREGRSRRLIALLGVRDLVVVDTPDALLVCSVERAQDVRAIVAELTRRGWRSFL